jgi:hypothetical protein
MNRPTFVTMSTLVFTLVAYVSLAQAAQAGDPSTLNTVSLLEQRLVQK